MPNYRHGKKKSDKDSDKYKSRYYTNRKISQNPAMKKYVCKMRYFSQISLNAPSGGLPSQHVFRTGDLFDPDLTGTGGQPMGFDELNALYNNYYVRSAHMKAIFTATGTSADTSTYIVSLTHSPDNWSNADAGRIIESKRGKWGFLSTSDAVGYKTLTCTAYPAAMLKLPYRNSELIGENAGSPNKTSYFIVNAIPQAPGTDAGTIRVTCTIDYLVEWTDPDILSRS